MQSDLTVQFSLHDIAPIHQARIEKACKYFADWGISKMTWLWVPNFHGQGSSANNEEFSSFLKSNRELELEWALHGYSHCDDTPRPELNTWHDTLRRRFMTAGEGEFLPLSKSEQIERIGRGKADFQKALGIVPKGFVAPAWLYRPELPSILASEGFSWTENHQGIENLGATSFIAAPVITWATRNWYMKYGSLLVCPWLAHQHRNNQLIRVAMHPHDFDHPQTVANIEKVVRGILLTERRQVSITDLVDQHIS